MSDRFSTTPGQASLGGTTIESELQRGVSYRLERQIGEGGMGTAFLALRQAPDGLAPVVIKMVRAGFGATGPADAAAGMLVQIEAVALGLLNERVPPTPWIAIIPAARQRTRCAARFASNAKPVRSML